MAHMTVANCNFEGQEADTVGGIGEVSQEELGTGYDYIALGHIHYPQTLKGSDGVTRYSGSPVPVSFDENYPHSVSVVTVERGRELEIREIRIKNVRPMLTVPAVPSSFQEALDGISAIGDDEECYVRLNILLREPMPADYMEKIAGALEGKRAAYCYCKITRPEVEAVEDATAVTYDEFRELMPIDVAQRFYRARFGEDMPERMSEMIEEAVKRYETY